jgi:hypothetical protein
MRKRAFTAFVSDFQSGARSGELPETNNVGSVFENALLIGISKRSMDSRLRSKTAVLITSLGAIHRAVRTLYSFLEGLVV